MDLPVELLNMLPDEPPSSVEVEAQNAVSDSHKPILRVEKDKRKGKLATLITGYSDDSDEVQALAKTLKQRLAVGGSTRDGEILLQGDMRQKVSELLKQLGYKVKTIQ